MRLAVIDAPAGFIPLCLGVPDYIVRAIRDHGGDAIVFICTDCRLGDGSGQSGSSGNDGGVGELAFRQLFQTVKELCKTVKILSEQVGGLIAGAGGQTVHSQPPPVEGTRLVIREEICGLEERRKRRLSIVIRGLAVAGSEELNQAFDPVARKLTGGPVLLSEVVCSSQADKLYRAKVASDGIKKKLVDNAPSLASSNLRHVFVNRDLTYVQRTELKKRRDSRRAAQAGAEREEATGRTGTAGFKLVGLQSSSVGCFSSLRFGFLNVNCLLNKLNYVSSLLTDFNLDIFGVLETWLLPSTPDSFVSICGYGVVRTDTAGNFAKHGVCIFIKNSITFVRVGCCCPNVCAIFLPKYKLHFILVYRPPSNSYIEDRLLIDFLLDFCIDKETVICGDFNLPDLDWKRRDCFFIEYPPRVQPFVNAFISLGFTQWVAEATFWCSSNTLDLVLTSEEDRVGDIEILPPFPSCGHMCVVFTYFFQFNVNSIDGGLPKRDWFRGRYGMINNHLSVFDWQLEFYDLGVSAMYSRLKEILDPLINRYVPLAKGPTHPKICHPPPSLKRERSRAWKSYKNLRGLYGRSSQCAAHALAIYSDLNDHYRRFFVHKQIAFERSLVSSLAEFPKRFHAYVRSKKVGNPSVGPLRKSDGTLIVKCDEMAEVFAEEFSSVYVVEELDHPAPHQVYDGTLDRISLSVDEVARFVGRWI